MSKLHVDSITKSFDEKKILRDIYISCETGKVVGLLGRNGSGKSTLLKIIFGTEKGDSQFIRVDDEVLQNQTDRKGKIAYLPQHFFLPKGIKIKNLIPLFCNRENSDKLFELNLIKPFLNETSRNLSGGEKKIVEVLLIIYSDSKFVLLDEPFNGLSPKITTEIQNIIKEQSKHKGIIISDHRYQEVLDISDDIYLLSDSYLKQIKDLKELQQYNYLPKSI
ncbi:ATP-binding cassette domain-containing protein [Chryseobacterium ginsengisoli]|uniref:ATP-binding cassette domain-containing protein n=1 Tax=Chryseobacterium ginsengisoli TaxID=363853 RepID=A0ABP9LXR2_9FLAO